MRQAAVQIVVAVTTINVVRPTRPVNRVGPRVAEQPVGVARADDVLDAQAVAEFDAAEDTKRLRIRDGQVELDRCEEAAEVERVVARVGGRFHDAVQARVRPGEVVNVVASPAGERVVTA